MRERAHCRFRFVLGALLALTCAPSFAATPAVPAASEPPGMVAARAAFDVLARDQGAAQVNAQLVSAFSMLAGSSENAQGLVSGLRTGQQVTLTSTAPAGSPVYTTINPPAGGMSWGDVYITLALAQASLNQQGIMNPSGAQLGDALTGILTQRSGGAGWGQIAQALGVKLGPIVSALRATNARLSAAQGDPAPAAQPVGTQTTPRPDRSMTPGPGSGDAAGGPKTAMPSGTLTRPS